MQIAAALLALYRFFLQHFSIKLVFFFAAAIILGSWACKIKCGGAGLSEILP